ncbi:MAG: hypothetical protein HC840_04935 [Leptolyngbyaceae cyanobacterium RM2_2_4]|nr:hypothetical protein [Leptolyngbyaceae cyanobacterium RM2_2_4]
MQLDWSKDKDEVYVLLGGVEPITTSVGELRVCRFKIKDFNKVANFIKKYFAMFEGISAEVLMAYLAAYGEDVLTDVLEFISLFVDADSSKLSQLFFDEVPVLFRKVVEVNKSFFTSQLGLTQELSQAVKVGPTE